MAFSLVQQIPSRVQTQLVHFVSSASPYPQYQKCLASALVPATLHLRLFRNPWRACNYPVPQEVLLLCYSLAGEFPHSWSSGTKLYPTSTRLDFVQMF